MDDIHQTIFQFLSPSIKKKVLLSHKYLPEVDLKSANYNLDDPKICKLFRNEDFELLIRNRNLDRQKLFKCVIDRGLVKYIDILLHTVENQNFGIKSIDPSVNNNYAIRKAAKEGYTEIVKLLLLDPRVDPSADYNNAIIMASRNGHATIVKLLLSGKIGRAHV